MLPGKPFIGSTGTSIPSYCPLLVIADSPECWFHFSLLNKQQMQAWRLRGGLPHLVEATWILTDAIMTDCHEDHGVTALTRRSCYCTAICRFVTGLLDSEQDSKYKVSMFEKATELGFPASFVELRHEATHGSLPSLAVLRKAAERALGWLWEAYWRDLDHGGSRGLELSPKFREILRSHSSRVTEYGKTLRAPHRKFEELSARLATVNASQLLVACEGNTLALTRLVDVLGKEMEMTASGNG